jgi:bifunctional enzyme CysN/CysC
MKTRLRISTMGSVDDGKSTLIGRLLYDSGNILQDQLAALERDSKGFQHGPLDFSLLTDGLVAEREQGITIDVAYRYFSTPDRDFVIADTPGHTQYTRNMVTGASASDVALLVVDAALGITDQTRRHAFIASLMGVPEIVVVINKMDLVGYSPKLFESLSENFTKISNSFLKAKPRFIPACAVNGGNIVNRDPLTPWYDGPTLMQVLLSAEPLISERPEDLRMPVQAVTRASERSRLYLGRVASGCVSVGDEILILPSYVKTKIREISTPQGLADTGVAGQSLALSLQDEVDISRGDTLVSAQNPPLCTDHFTSTCIWLSKLPLRQGHTYKIQRHHRLYKSHVAKVQDVLNVNTLLFEEKRDVQLNDIFRCQIETQKPLALDTYSFNRATGHFIVIDPDTHETVGAGTVSQTSTAIVRSRTGSHSNFEAATQFKFLKESHLRQKAMTVWLTGLSGAGKSTLAEALEKKLLQEGFFAVVLDGDQIRSSLNQDLGFTPYDRKENIRRVAALARLLNDNGLIVIASLISPFIEDRDLARKRVGDAFFREVFVDAPLSVCEARDPKSLYKKARTGGIQQFTGVSAKYEPPHHPDLVVHTDQENLEASLERLYNWLKPLIK